MTLKATVPFHPQLCVCAHLVVSLCDPIITDRHTSTCSNCSNSLTCCSSYSKMQLTRISVSTGKNVNIKTKVWLIVFSELNTLAKERHWQENEIQPNQRDFWQR